MVAARGHADDADRSDGAELLPPVLRLGLVAGGPVAGADRARQRVDRPSSPAVGVDRSPAVGHRRTGGMGEPHPARNRRGRPSHRRNRVAVRRTHRGVLRQLPPARRPGPRPTRLHRRRLAGAGRRRPLLGHRRPPGQRPGSGGHHPRRRVHLWGDAGPGPCPTVLGGGVHRCAGRPPARRSHGQQRTGPLAQRRAFQWHLGCRPARCGGAGGCGARRHVGPPCLHPGPHAGDRPHRPVVGPRRSSGVVPPGVDHRPAGPPERRRHVHRRDRRGPAQLLAADRTGHLRVQRVEFDHRIRGRVRGVARRHDASHPQPDRPDRGDRWPGRHLDARRLRSDRGCVRDSGQL